MSSNVFPFRRIEAKTTLRDALKMYAGERRRQRFSANADHRYGRELERFAAHVGPDTPIDEITPTVCRSWLDTFTNHAASTVALEHTIMTALFKFLVLDDILEMNPMDKLRRPRVPALRDRKRTRITSEQVQTMLEACNTWPERMCLNTLALMGIRRTALANLKWGSVDKTEWTASFLEKGSKRIAKPVPLELQRVWKRYEIECGPFEDDDWVIPNRRPMPKRAERSSRFIYHTVKDVSERCGINAHVHAFRAAFAVHFLRNNPKQIEALRQLLGHSSLQTTLGYLDELEGAEAMRVVESLSYAPQPLETSDPVEESVEVREPVPA